MAATWQKTMIAIEAPRPAAVAGRCAAGPPDDSMRPRRPVPFNGGDPSIATAQRKPACARPRI
jgi:hypothetical protein